MRDTGGKLGAPRAVCAFLAGVLLNVAATLCMVAYSEEIVWAERGGHEAHVRNQ